MQAERERPAKSIMQTLNEKAAAALFSKSPQQEKMGDNGRRLSTAAGVGEADTGRRASTAEGGGTKKLAPLKKQKTSRSKTKGGKKLKKHQKSKGK
jgi:hypothetical protein